MRAFTRLLVLQTLLLLPVPSLLAQAVVDPSGHWEGSIQIPGRELTFEIDLTRNANGELSGTINNPAEHIKGLPLRAVVVDGRSVSLDARRDQPLKGILSDDGRSMVGDATVSGYVLPFTLTRTGDARIEPPTRSAAIARELEGVWNGTLHVDGRPLQLVLKMSNQPDSTAIGSIVSVDEGDQEFPVAITQKGSSVTLAVTMIGASYSGEVNPEGTELAGTYSHGSLVAPLTFRLAKP